MSIDDDREGHGGVRYFTKWADIAAVFVGLMAAVVTAGIPVINSPVAAADDGVTADPWIPLPIFGPKPAPKPWSLVTAQQQKPSAPGGKGVSWPAKAAPSFEAIQQAMTSLNSALNGSDITAMRTACRQLSSAGAQLGATLPTPVRAMTDEAQAAVEEISAASSACLADSPDPSAVASHSGQAYNHLGAVAKMVQGG